jgi:ABC-2 type transport system permease protein
MAGLNPVGEDLQPDVRPVSSRQHFATITWLRWRIFVNSLRGKGAAGELIVKVISYPFLALMILAPSIGSGFAGYYLVSQNETRLLAIPMWIIFVLWQFIGVSTSATGPSFNLASLVRFPIRYRDYLLIRLSFGLLDPPTVAGICCLFALSIGIAIANFSLFPWALLILVIYAVCNILFSRMIYSWLEKWLAQRRTRELVAGLILVGSVAAQFASQFVQRSMTNIGRGGHHPTLSPFWRQVIHVGLTVNWLLPPGLAASSIDHFQRGLPLIAVATLVGLLAYPSAFFLVFQLRMRAEFRGENLSEAPLAAKSRAAILQERAAVRERSSGAPAFAFLPASVAAILFREFRYLLRSGPRLYTLILPVVILFVFSMRTAGVNYSGMGHQQIPGLIFCYGCAYTQFILVGLMYNSLGSDGAGVQFYFVAPVSMRQVMLGKNLLTFAIFAIEIVVIYTVSCFLAKPPSADLTTTTIAWTVFVMFLNVTIGNARSIVSPRVLDVARVRGQNVSGLNGLISMVVVLVCGSLGAGAILACHFLLHTDFWIAAAVFSLLAVGSVVLYVVMLAKLDGLAARHVEDLTKTLAKV